MKKLFAILLVLAMLLSLAACGGSSANSTPAAQESSASSQPESTSEEAAEPSADAPSEIKIGLIGPVTGDTAFLGEQMQQLMELVQADLNEAGGINGIPVSLSLEDDTGVSSGAATAAQKLVDVTGVNVIVGPLFTSNVLAIKPIVNEAQVPAMIATSADSGIFQENGYVFSLDAANDVSVRLVSQYLLQEKGFTKLAILGNFNDQTLDMIGYWEQFWGEAGGEIVYSATFNSGADDFRTELTKIKEAAPEVLWIHADGEEFRSMARQIVELGLDDVFLATDYQAVQGDVLDVIGEAVDGRLVYTRNGVANDEATMAKYDEFCSKWEAAYGGVPESHVCLLYDCIYLVVEAMEESGAYSGEALREALLANTDFVGVSGYPIFDTFGKSAGSSTLVSYEGGESVLLDYKIQ